MNIPDFSTIPLRSGSAPAADPSATPASTWETPEGIDVRPLYTARDAWERELEELEEAESAAS